MKIRVIDARQTRGRQKRVQIGERAVAGLRVTAVPGIGQHHEVETIDSVFGK